MSESPRRCVIAIDAGTTGVRSRAIFVDDGETAASYSEFDQKYPQPGWVEHDVEEIWDVARSTLNDVIGRVGKDSVAAIGITNQRETVVAWNRRTGKPYGTAIVWQDRRTADRCEALREAGHLPLVRDTTGLVLDPYFSASKFEWLLTNRDIPIDDELALGTIDSWLIWNLTGGQVHATDVTNASRTMLFDIRTLQWSSALCDLFGIPMSALAEVRPSSGRFGTTTEASGCPDGIPISGVAGDQQAALFGQACFTPGMAKNTYGTGSFVLLNVGPKCPPPTEGMLTTVAWQLSDGTLAYALEGAIFVTGAAVQWLRDGLGLIQSASEIGPLAASTPDSGGVYLVPAFAGLGSPWWDPYAAGHHRRHHTRHVEGPSRTCRDRGDGLSDSRRGRGDVGRQWYHSRRAASRWRRIGDGPVVADAIRSTRCHGATSGRSGDGPRSAPPTWPGWPRVCGRRWTRSTSAGRSTPRTTPNRIERSPTSHTPVGFAPSSDLADGSTTHEAQHDRCRWHVHRADVWLCGLGAARRGRKCRRRRTRYTRHDGPGHSDVPTTHSASVVDRRLVARGNQVLLARIRPRSAGCPTCSTPNRAGDWFARRATAEPASRPTPRWKRSKAHRAPSTAVVIGTGYNEGSIGFAQNFDLIVSAARAKGAVRIVWMNYRLRDGLTRAGTDNNGSYVSNNATLQQLVASGDVSRRVHRQLARLQRAGAVVMVRCGRDPLSAHRSVGRSRLHLAMDHAPLPGAVPETNERRRSDRDSVPLARRPEPARRPRPVRLAASRAWASPSSGCGSLGRCDVRSR